MLRNSRTVESIGFLVDERPIALHGVDIKSFDVEYLTNLDPTQWLEPLKIFEGKKEAGEEVSFNEVTTLRLAVSQNLETVLGLLFATLQAPWCITGWLSFYNVNDLRSLCMKVRKEEPFGNRFSLVNANWKDISNRLWSRASEDSREKFNNALEELVEFFMQSMNSDEYNALKHGFRVSKSSLHLSFAPSEDKENCPPVEDFMSIGKAKFGSSFISVTKQDKINYTVQKKHVNWDLEELNYIASHIYLTGNNLLWKLHQIREIESDIEPLEVTIPDYYEKPKEAGNDLHSLFYNPNIKLKKESFYSKERIMDSYEKA